MTLDVDKLMGDKYILKGKKVVATNNLSEWAEFFENSEQRIVMQTMVGKVKVSTVFLGLDHRWLDRDRGPPIVFETMVFGGTYDGLCERYATYEEAEEGHKVAVELVRGIEECKEE